MIKKGLAALLVSIVILFSFSSVSFACDENQTNTYVLQILFGDSAQSKASDEKTKMLMDALYLCSEQHDNLGQDKISYLKSKNVSGVPSLSNINVKKDILMECSHNSWEYEFKPAKKNQANRKKALQNTVNKVFDFGFVNNLFGSKSGKCDSFSAVLYYSHILADYLADDPTDTIVNVNGKLTPSFNGQANVIINGDKPSFTTQDTEYTVSFITYSRPLDNLKRAGKAFGYIGPDMIQVGGRENIGDITPSGWNNTTLKNNNNAPQTVYNRSHIIAHQLGGADKDYNIVTGTDYMNKYGMKPLEDEVVKYINTTGNHVLYRVTPIYKKDNQVCSGVQMEAFSVEDSGRGICFNRFCYNVQPGFKINYSNGENSFADTIVNSENSLPFAISNASEANSDLIFEMNKHLSVVFKDQENSDPYKAMMREIDSVANVARDEARKENSSNKYIKMRSLQYEYFQVLKRYVPKLLEKEEFFKSAF